jgi:hypothetical protein
MKTINTLLWLWSLIRRSLAAILLVIAAFFR